MLKIQLKIQKTISGEIMVRMHKKQILASMYYALCLSKDNSITIYTKDHFAKLCYNTQYVLASSNPRRIWTYIYPMFGRYVLQRVHGQLSGTHCFILFLKEFTELQLLLETSIQNIADILGGKYLYTEKNRKI